MDSVACFEQLNNGLGVDRAIERIAEVNDAIDLSICDIVKHRRQSDVITVNVSYDRDPHEFYGVQTSFHLHRRNPVLK